LTISLGLNPDSFQTTVYNALVSSTSLKSLILNLPIKNVSLVPSNIDLSGAEVELQSILSREHKLKNALKDIPSFDYIIVDCPPSLGNLTINALTAADLVIIPVQSEYLALRALQKHSDLVEMVRQNTNPKIKTKYIITMFNKSTIHSQEVLQEAKDIYKDIFKSVIPRTIKFPDSATAGKSILHYLPGSPGAEAYKSMAKELVC